MRQPKDPRKTMLIFSAVVLVFMLVMNLFVVPRLMQPTTVTYNEFLAMVEEGKVSQVALDDTGTSIEFLSTDEKGRKVIYTTGAMNDPDLVHTLQQAKTADGKPVDFYKEPLTRQSSMLSFVITWILPIALMMGLGFLLMRMMQKKMGGNAMSFGKSNAKVYVQAQTGNFCRRGRPGRSKRSAGRDCGFPSQPRQIPQCGRRDAKRRAAGGPSGHR